MFTRQYHIEYFCTNIRGQIAATGSYYLTLYNPKEKPNLTSRNIEKAKADILERRKAEKRWNNPDLTSVVITTMIEVEEWESKTEQRQRL